MEALYSYFSSLLKKILSYWWSGSSLAVESSSAAENTSANQIEEEESESPSKVISDQLQIRSQFYPDQTADVDKINILVKCAGKTTEVNVFPLERISVLLKEACEVAGKKPEKMRLVFEGDLLDVNKTVNQYHLRGGSTVNLIHA